MKLHRIFQLIGLYGVLFMIPFLQQQINDYSGEEEKNRWKQTDAIVKHVYYDVKKITCSQLGQSATTHDCKKGVYQDTLLKLALEQEDAAASKKSDSISSFWIIYYIFAFFAFVGAAIEYRKEYENDKNSQKSGITTDDDLAPNNTEELVIENKEKVTVEING
jgi:hypothetical protein